MNKVQRVRDLEILSSVWDIVIKLLFSGLRKLCIRKGIKLIRARVNGQPNETYLPDTSRLRHI